MTYRLLAVSAAACLAGCGAILQGTHQDIAVSSTPAGAHCDLKRPNGSIAATVERTPETVRLRKTTDDLTLDCVLPGYQPASLPLASGYGFAVFGNLVLGYGPGWAIDHMSGSDNQYPHAVRVTLVPVGAPPQQPATPAAGSKPPS